MTAPVLFVDDEVRVLQGYRRRLRGRYEISIAESGREGLEKLAVTPHAVVVSDMRMPEMDGIVFLGKVREQFPGTVRIMLTGHGDMATAIDAVNESNIFRFLNKPCEAPKLMRALDDALEQARLVQAEKELLEKTLRGSVKVLTDTLSLINPLAFSKAGRVRRLAREIAENLGLPQAWQYELAAMLSQIGCVTVPVTVFEKLQRHTPLSVEEERMLAQHPAMGHQLLAQIPRLELVARMIKGQQRPYLSYELDEAAAAEEKAAALGAQLLKVLLDYDQHLSQGRMPQDAVRLMRKRSGQYNTTLLDALGQDSNAPSEPAVRAPVEKSIRELREGMVAAEDIRSNSDILLVAKNQQITSPLLTRLRNYYMGVGVREPVRVFPR